jgi:HlyD family secretion protein
MRCPVVTTIAEAENSHRMRMTREFSVRLLGAFLLSALALVQLPGGARAADANSGAIGQIVPAGGLISLAGPPGAFVAEVKVAPGDEVIAGTVLITLTGDALIAEHQLAVAEAAAAETRAASEVSAQALAVDLARQRLAEATRQTSGYRAIGPRSTSANELARLEAAESQARVGLQIEEARLSTARAEAARLSAAADERLALATTAMEIRAPSNGTVLRVDRRAGQRLGNEPAVHMGDLSTMYVLCQVYEGDLLQLRPGMTATIRSATLGEPMTGVVEDVARLVDTRARLGDVRIRLDRPEPANRLVGMEVEVVIARQ